MNCLLTLSWWRPISYRNQSIDLQSKSVDWFLYDRDLRHKRVKRNSYLSLPVKLSFFVKSLQPGILLHWSVPKKCPYLEFFWSVFCHIWTKYGEIRISLCIQSECWKICTRKTPHTDTFYAVGVPYGDKLALFFSIQERWSVFSWSWWRFC